MDDYFLIAPWLRGRAMWITDLLANWMNRRSEKGGTVLGNKIFQLSASFPLPLQKHLALSQGLAFQAKWNNFYSFHKDYIQLGFFWTKCYLRWKIKMFKNAFQAFKTTCCFLEGTIHEFLKRQLKAWIVSSEPDFIFCQIEYFIKKQSIPLSA